MQWMKTWHCGTASEQVPVPLPSSCPALSAHCASLQMEELPLELLSSLQMTLAWFLSLLENSAQSGHRLWQPGCKNHSLVLPQLSRGPQPHTPGLHTGSLCMMGLHSRAPPHFPQQGNMRVSSQQSTSKNGSIKSVSTALGSLSQQLPL